MAESLYKIVCFGDSTTDDTYVPSNVNFRGQYKDLKVYSTWLKEELPNTISKKVEVINSGVSSDTTFDGKLRFNTDVLEHNPDLVIIQFGANDQCIRQDIGLTTPIISTDQFAYNLLFFINRLKKRNVEIILMTPGIMLWANHFRDLFFRLPYDLDDSYGLNGNLTFYADKIRIIAKREQVHLVDLYEEQLKYDKKNGQSLSNFLPDGLHPNNEGHKFIAMNLLDQIKLIHQNKASD